MNSNRNLVWLDLEMSGLDVKKHEIIEIALAVTDINLNIVAMIDPIAIFHEDDVFESMCEWNQSTHSRTGLIDRCKASNYNYKTTQEAVLKFLNAYCTCNKPILCGNSIYVDRIFLSKYMPKIHEFFHYQLLDVTSFRMYKQMWGNPPFFSPKQSHSALADVIESIDEMKFYLKDNEITSKIK